MRWNANKLFQRPSTKSCSPLKIKNIRQTGIKANGYWWLMILQRSIGLILRRRPMLTVLTSKSSRRIGQAQAIYNEIHAPHCMKNLFGGRSRRPQLTIGSTIAPKRRRLSHRPTRKLWSQVMMWRASCKWKILQPSLSRQQPTTARIALIRPKRRTLTTRWRRGRRTKSTWWLKNRCRLQVLGTTLCKISKRVTTGWALQAARDSEKAPPIVRTNTNIYTNY